MTETTLTPDISKIKSQLATEISKYQSEIYLRQAKIHALDVFGNSDTVEDWLRAKNPALDGMAPVDLLNSPAGKDRVIDLVKTIERRLELLRERIDRMERTPIDPESEDDFQSFMEIFDAQRSIDSKLFSGGRSF
jgi:hypothetical protein